MRMSALDRTKLRTLLIVVVFSTIGSAIFGVLIGEASADSSNISSILIGAYNGCLISLLIASFEIFSGDMGALFWLKRAPFLLNVVVRSVYYLAVFTLVVKSSFAVVGVEPVGWGWRDANFLTTITVSFANSIMFNVIARIDQMLGPGVLAKFLTGHYYRPREEERIFMFLDLVGSTALAEHIGHLASHRLLNEFIRDLSEPILVSRGEIHDYVGDEVIVTWKPELGLHQGRCIRCFIDICEAIDARSDTYQLKYGVIPQFRAALHIGPVVAGEMGVVKQAIKFLGDTVNTTARIETACKKLGEPLLVSVDLVDRLGHPDEFAFEDIGLVSLRGKTEPLRLFRLNS